MQYRFIALIAALAFSAAAASANPRFEYVQNAALQDAPLSTDYILGNKSAPVVLVEYASLTCPHCAHFHKDVLPELTKRYISTGKLLYILRPYPLNEPALKAAELIDCVGGSEGSGRYYTFARVLFETQNKWAFDTTWQASLATIARVGGVNADMYGKCTTDNEREVKVLKMKQLATKELGVDHTPYLFINSHRYDDEASTVKLIAYIDGLLSKVEKPAAKSTKKAKKSKDDQ